MPTYTEPTYLSDVVKFEVDDARLQFCRKVYEVYAGQDLDIGDICQASSSANDAKQKVVAGASDVQTLTMSAGTDDGTMVLRYKGIATAPLAHDVSVADFQVALRALHADLAACVVTTVGGVSVDYVITTPGVAVADLEISEDALLDGSVLEPAKLVHTTQGYASGARADSICLENVACANEVQTAVMAGTPTGGNFTITLTKKDGTRVTTGSLTHDESVADINTAIDTALGEAGQCVATTPGASALPDQTITFTWSGASYSGRPQELIEVTLTALTGGTPTCVIARTTAGKGGTAVFLERGPAVVDKAYLDFNSCTEANVIAALTALGILVRTGPTYTTAP